MGAADGEAKVNKDAFRAGGGSNGDLDGGYPCSSETVMTRATIELALSEQLKDWPIAQSIGSISTASFTLDCST